METFLEKDLNLYDIKMSSLTGLIDKQLLIK